MNFKRIISGIIGLPIVMIVFLLGNKYIVDVVIALVALVSMHEYVSAFKSSAKAKPISWIAYFACLVIAVIHIIPNEYLIYILAIFIPLAVFGSFMYAIVTDLKVNIRDVGVTILGICYVALFYAFIPLIYGMENGKYYIWFLITIGWGTDVFAYIVGKNIGKHKFTPISPNKSIEGCVGGTLGAVFMATLYTLILNNAFGFSVKYVIIMIMAFILSIIGQIGDLSASAIKRYNGIKDFGKIIPGHGGFLDRFDSIIFIAPFAYFILMLI